jgi:hypothetical protein
VEQDVRSRVEENRHGRQRRDGGMEEVTLRARPQPFALAQHPEHQSRDTDREPGQEGGSPETELGHRL